MYNHWIDRHSNTFSYVHTWIRKVAFHTNQQQQPKWKAPVMTSPHQSVTTGMSLGGTSPFKSHALLSRQSNGLILSWFNVYGSCYWLEGRLSGLHPFRQWKMSSLIIPLQNLDWLGGRISHCLGREGGGWLGKYIKVHENNLFYLAFENLFFYLAWERGHHLQWTVCHVLIW